MAAALRRAGRKDFSDRSFVEPLRRLICAYNEEADLSVFGNYAARFDVLRCLGNLLTFDAVEEEKRDIVSRRIVRPIFIAGVPRSGTTFLHTLLAQDPANAVPRFWQLIYPYPLRRCFSRGDCRRTRVERQLSFFRRLSPELDGLHPVATDAPQECTDITAQMFQSLRFDTTHRVPSYLRWLDRHGHHAAYCFHRRFLQHLDAQAPGRQWILKCPDHVFALDAIQSVYPDARIVFLHRDPVNVLASVSKLTELLRRPFTRRIDRAEIGREVSGRWIEGALRMIMAADRTGAERILHLHYREVVSAPMETVATLYRHSGLALSGEARQRMQAYLHRMPRGGYGMHRYSLSEFGLDAAHLRERFSAYMDFFWHSAGEHPHGACTPAGEERGMKRAALFAFLIGAAIMAALIVHAGAGAVVQAMASLGLGGLGVISLLHVPVIALLGFGWWAIGRGVAGAVPSKFVLARLVRDAAADVLPFSQVGGFVIGARALTLMGLRIVPVGVSMLTDLVIELSVKLPYVLVGLLLLLYVRSGLELLRPVFLGLALAAAGLSAAAAFRARMMAVLERAAMALRGRWAGLGLDTHAGVQAVFDRVFAHDGRMLASFLLHGLAEAAGAVETWVIFRLIGVPITGFEAVLIDSLTSGLRTFGFLVPAAIGVQEAIYVLACGAVGISPAIAIAFSLVRRARDLAIGVPGLGAWQAIEGRRLFSGSGAGKGAQHAGQAQQ